MSDIIITAEERFALRMEQSAIALIRRQMVKRARETVMPRFVAANDREPDAA